MPRPSHKLRLPAPRSRSEGPANIQPAQLDSPWRVGKVTLICNMQGIQLSAVGKSKQSVRLWAAMVMSSGGGSRGCAPSMRATCGAPAGASLNRSDGSESASERLVSTAPNLRLRLATPAATDKLIDVELIACITMHQAARERRAEVGINRELCCREAARRGVALCRATRRKCGRRQDKLAGRRQL